MSDDVTIKVETPESGIVETPVESDVDSTIDNAVKIADKIVDVGVIQAAVFDLAEVVNSAILTINNLKAELNARFDVIDSRLETLKETEVEEEIEEANEKAEEKEEETEEVKEEIEEEVKEETPVAPQKRMRKWL